MEAVGRGGEGCGGEGGCCSGCCWGVWGSIVTAGGEGGLMNEDVVILGESVGEGEAGAWLVGR